MSGTLAIILGIIAGALILFGLGAIWYNRRQQSQSAKYQSIIPASRTPQEELSALGILEIKPRTAASYANDDEETEQDVEIIEVDDSEEAQDEEPDEVEEGVEMEAALEEDEEEVAVSDLKNEPDDALDEPTETFDSEAESDDEAELPDMKRAGVSRREALFRLLNAVQASVDGYTACLIKRDANGRCHVEAIVSQNAPALGPESFVMDDLLDSLAPSGTAVLVKDIDTNKSPEEVLGYYGSPVNVRQVAIAPIKVPTDDESFFLLVDALGWQDLDDPWQRLMIGQFSTLLGTFMSTPLTVEEGGEYIKPRVRPRREIIADEIERARAGKHDLALALIYLNRAEEIANEGGKSISDAERAMANRLELAANDGRLERFGELTYGIFQDEGVSEVEAWALQLQDQLVREGDHFEGGVSIGIALLQKRHKDADDFRADATEALREAFETGACTIIE